MLKNQAWQKIPGAHGAEIYPMIRKPDVLSCNSFVIRTAEKIVVVDPGSLELQTEHLVGVLNDLVAAKPRPVLICLSHCHIDHVLSVLQLKNKACPQAGIILQKTGADALRAGNRQVTIADLYDFTVPHLVASVETFPLDENAACDSLEIASGRRIDRRIFPLGGDDKLELYHTPGHSPCSVCIRIGDLLMIGDILLAANPLVAGIPGWNREDFIRSVENILLLIDAVDIRCCCPGHGKDLDRPVAKKVLESLLENIKALPELEAMNLERFRYHTALALEILEEASEVFTIIAGRIYTLCWRLEELEENEAAAEYMKIMEIEKIDACLTECNRFAEEFRRGGRMEVEFTFKVIGAIQRVLKLFDAGKMEGVVDKALVRRASKLLLDFLETAQGVRLDRVLLPVNINDLVSDVMQDILADPHKDASIIDTADNRQDYLAALVSRLAHISQFDEAALTFEPGSIPGPVLVEPQRFHDTFKSLLEELSFRDSIDAIKICTGLDPQGAAIFIRVEAKENAGRLPDVKADRYRRRFEECGGRFICDSEENTTVYGIYWETA